MKAVRFNQFGGPEVLEIVDVSDPHPGRGQVRIAVRGTALYSAPARIQPTQCSPRRPQPHSETFVPICPHPRLMRGAGEETV
jgi:NADPH:quinone reductase-like Zn-dependent oxidoreductase